MNEPIATQTIAVANQGISDQQNTNSVADRITPALLSAILENENSVSPFVTEPLTADSSSKRSIELLLGEEQPINSQLTNKPADLLHAAPITQGSIVQSTQSYTLTATSNCSLTTPIRDSSPRLEEVAEQEWFEDDPMLESPSTHDEPPGLSFGEQHEEHTKMHVKADVTIESSFIIITGEGENDESAKVLKQPRRPQNKLYPCPKVCLPPSK